MYMMIGGDGQEYGPVTEEKIEEWIEEGRANGFTRVRPEGETDWQSLNGRSEFRAALERYCPDTLEKATPSQKDHVTEAFDPDLARELPPFNIANCLLGGLQLLLSHLPLFFTVSLLYWILRTTAQVIPVLGGILGMAVSGALYAGLCLVFLRRLRGQETGLQDLFAGFSILYLPLTITFILIRLFSGVGFLFFVLPGVYLWVAWLFAIPLIVDRDYDFWQAMETSRQRVTRVWFHVLAVYGIVLSPLILYMVYFYIRIFGMTGELFEKNGMANPLELMETIRNNPELLEKISNLAAGQQIITVLLTPFVTAVLMQGYALLFPSHED